MLYILIASSIVILIQSYRVNKDILSPAVIFPIPWIISAIMLVLSDFDFSQSSLAYLALLMGIIVFEIGYYIGYHRINPYKRLENNESVMYINITTYKIILFLELVFVVYVLTRYVSFIKQNALQNLFSSFYTNKDRFEGLLGISYGRNILCGITIYSYVIFMFLSLDEKKKFSKLLIIQTILSVICAISKMTRNGVLADMLPIVFVSFIVFKQRSKKVFYILLIALVVFMIYFAYISSSKYYYLYERQNQFDVLKNQIAYYSSSSLVAFQKTIDTGGYIDLYGKNTFSFFTAIYDRIAGTNITPDLMQNFILIGNGQETNVYTFYYYTMRDFGFIYSLMAQLVVGILNGLLYKGVGNKKKLSIYFYALLSYALVMEFFQDQYISLLSRWIQFLLVGLLLFHTNIVSSYKPYKKSIRNMK